MTKSRRYVITANEGSEVFVEVRLSRTQREMCDEALRIDGVQLDKNVKGVGTQGACQSWTARRSRNRKTQIGKTEPNRGCRVVARIYFNLEYLDTNVFTHESGHAAMAYSRYRQSNLKVMKGEEVMCYSLGHICQELGNLFHRIGAFT